MYRLFGENDAGWKEFEHDIRCFDANVFYLYSGENQEKRAIPIDFFGKNDARNIGQIKSKIVTNIKEHLNMEVEKKYRLTAMTTAAG